ncbi:MAG: DNA/RNA nuclease SfsA [Hyphomicrobiales bacterium]
MRFPAPLVPGTLLKRYKRFLADIRLGDGETITAHCANPGSMLGLAEPGMKVWLSRSDSPTRKLKYSWELVEAGPCDPPCLVGINTGHPNRLVADAIGASAIAELTGYDSLRREVKYGRNSRIDLLLEKTGAPPCYVEIKNVHLMREAHRAEFPDSVTARGAKHLAELAREAERGSRAVMLYLVQRPDAKSFSLARDIDPAYAAAFAEARAAGVEALCYRCDISPEEIALAGPVEIAG